MEGDDRVVWLASHLSDALRGASKLVELFDTRLLAINSLQEFFDALGE